MLPLLPLLLACAEDPSKPSEPSPEPGPTLSTEPTDPTEPPSTPTTPAEPVPGIAEALLDDCGAPSPVGVGTPGDGLRRIVLTAPEAVCNDGSPAVVYVRAATDPEALDRWIFTLEGGSWCGNWEACRTRWCGEGTYEADMMSSNWAPETVGGGGIMSRGEHNDYAGWNHVFLDYCSSDFWTGRKGDVVLEGDPSYLVHFRGHDIVMATLDRLDGGAVSDDGTELLPPLVDADEIVFGGISAGGFGALQVLDEVAARYADVPVVGLIDGMVYPEVEHFTTPGVAEGVEAGLIGLYDTTIVPYYDAFFDEDCVAAHTATGEVWRCGDAGIVERDFVSTPFLITYDLFDSVVDDYYVFSGASQLEFAVAGEATVRGWATTRPELSFRVSACGQHTMIDKDPWFFGAPVIDAVAGGSAWTAHDALGAFRDGQQVVAIDSPDGAGSVCP